MIGELLFKSLHEGVRPHSFFEVIDEAVVAKSITAVAIHQYPPASKFSQLTSLILAHSENGEPLCRVNFTCRAIPTEFTKLAAAFLAQIIE